MPEHICPECGKIFPPDSLAGMCPHCLLNLGVRPACGPPAAPAPAARSAEHEFAATVLGAVPPRQADDASEKPGDRIGRYKLLQRIGEGGMGIVYMAEQVEPVRRKVAVKIIKLGMDTKQVVARFEAERQALALMDHPNIAKVFDGGATASSRSFFVMELVQGIPLTSYCDTRKLTTRERLELFIRVCQAVQHAHQKGIIHRDLKPSNILVTEQDGRAVPKVIDFGIAKATDGVLTEKTLFTQFNQMIGTPAYMSPEQAGLGRLDIDTRSDIYSLGALLYELLTGRTPLDPQKLREVSYEAMLKTIREVEPPKPSTCLSALELEELTAIAGLRHEDPQRLHMLVRGDLDWIVVKALEKDRSRRYDSANVLAEDLRRYLDNEPISARPPSNLYRFQKLARRNKLLLGTAGAVATALVFGLVIALWQADRAKRHLAQARLNAYASEMNVAQQAIAAENNLERARELLEKHRPKPGDKDLRGFEWRYLWQICQGEEIAIFRDAPPGGLGECAVAFSPDGRFFSYAGGGRVVVLDAHTYRSITNITTHVNALTFSPNSRVLVTSAIWPEAVKFWDTTTWTESTPSALIDARVPAIFSPDGHLLVTGTSGTNTLRLWKTESWECVASCPQTPLLPIHDRSSVTFSPDGKFLVTHWMDLVSIRWGTRVWRVPTLEHHVNLFPEGMALLSATFLPHTSYLLTGSWRDQLLVWDLDSHPPKMIQAAREHSAYVPAIAVAPGSRTFATASADQSICIWDASTFKRLARWRGHTREVWALAMSPDGSTVASSSLDGTVRLWRGQPLDRGDTWSDAGIVAGFSSDGRSVVFGPREGDYRWQVVTGTNRVVIPIPSQPALKFDFNITPHAVHGTEPIAALGRTEGTIELWNLGARQLVDAWAAGTNWISAVAFSPDGSNLATANELGVVNIWNLKPREEISTFQALNGRIGAMTFSGDGRMLAVGFYNVAETRIWNLAPLKMISLPVPANQIAFAPSGKTVITCSVAANEAQIWELPSGQRMPSLKGHVGGITELAFSPDGRTLATGAYDGRIKLWNLATSQEVATFPHPGTINSLRFSPDGRTLAASFLVPPEMQVQLFRAPSFDEIAAEEKRRSRTPQR